MRGTTSISVIAAFVLMLAVADAVASAKDTPGEMIDRVKRSIVVVHAIDDGGTRFGVATGFVVAKGVIATNVHVLRGASRIGIVRSDGKKLVGTGIRAFDARHDVALVQLSDAETDGDIPPLKFAADDSIKTGIEVYIVGHPQGLEFTATRGIVSAGERVLDGVDYVQTDAATAPGSSGSPWLNEAGEVVGIHVRAAKADVFGKTQGFNLGTHSKYVAKLAGFDNKYLLSPDHFSGKPRVAGKTFVRDKPADALVGALHFNGGKLADAVRQVGGKCETDDRGRLRFVNVHGCGLSDAGVQAIVGETSLTGLNINGNPALTDESLRLVASMPNLTVLNAGQNRFTDAGVAALSKMKLKVLDIGGCEQITDEGLASLSEMKSLEGLHVFGTQATDQSFQHIESLTGLKVLHLAHMQFGTKCTKAAIDRFRSRRPSCDVRLK